MNYNLYTINKSGFFKKKFEIFRNDELLYHGKLKFFLRGIVLFDINGNQVLEIKKKLKFFKSHLYIKQGNSTLAFLEKPAFSREWIVTSNDEILKLKGNILGYEFTFIKDDREIAKLSKETFKFNNGYGLAIEQGQNELLILGSALAMELWKNVRKAKSG